ncbi:MAG: mandelate racemase/muconate lactonizing protein [Planctomycetes bacterium]|nr:mandelate racemase/muconate lactonizing protein [Planctomycetota bacterium]
MKRRDFVKSVGLCGLQAFVANPLSLLAAEEGGSTAEESGSAAAKLREHVVDHAELLEVNFRWPRFVGKNGRIGDHGQHKKCTVLKLRTHQGAMGWGLSHRNAKEELEEVKGKTLTQLIAPGRGISAGVPKTYDFALHDLMGVVLQKPVYQLLGAQGPKASPVYSGMIYLDELNAGDSKKSIDPVLANCQWDIDYGYRQLKVKIGRSGRWYPHDEGLQKDIEVVKAIHELVAPQGTQLLVDANDVYSLKDTQDFLRGIGDVPLVWVEEPFVENIKEGRLLRKWMNENGFKNTYYADGERQPNHSVCMTLAEENNLDVYLPDINGYGFSAWLELMPKLRSMNTLASPHAWGDRLKTHYIAHLAAGLGNVVTVEGVTCLSDDIDYGNYPIREGRLHVSEAPGFGMTLLTKS